MNQKATTATVDIPQDIALELSDVCFPSRRDSFRVQVAVSGTDLPMRLWLESKQECVVTTIQDHHVPKGADFVLPSSVVLFGLQRGLTALLAHGNAAPDGCHVQLKYSKNGHVELSLALHFFSALSAKYIFDLVPLAVHENDVLSLASAICKTLWTRKCLLFCQLPRLPSLPPMDALCGAN
ncbi:Aste57867_15964 [Aphanomyces stellatus]|uniref:Aste57867_15964 protein n=1 Tax=Aphanomyces stellatus TaxID=120398 RepID=A0A485L5B0_9STRA|nr:hypothetical protein As57867_015908 [Aphanomyces stellatus]VFT92749.1 Aste57867_15964 [Aphanomyces stellatus]